MFNIKFYKLKVNGRVEENNLPQHGFMSTHIQPIQDLYIIFLNL